MAGKPGHRRFGYIRKLPSGRYQASYVGPDGDRHAAPATFDAKIDAEAWLAAESRAVAHVEGWRAPAQRVADEQARRERARRLTFDAVADEMLAARQLAVRTEANYRGLLDRHILPTFAGVPVSEITRGDVKGWYRGVAPGSPPTRKHAYDLLRNVMNFAVDEEYIATSPVRIKSASTEQRTGETVPATLAQLEALVVATPDQYRLMVMLAAWCALRRGEMRELRRSDVDHAAGVIKVRRSVVFVPGRGAVVKAPKTAAGVRDVAIPPHLMPAVREHLLAHCQPGADGLMFPAAQGGHMWDAAFGRWYYPAREAAGRPDLRFHDLRHTGAVLAAQSGATVAELMHRLGHTTPAAAMRYQHAAGERDRQIAAGLSALAQADGS